MKREIDAVVQELNYIPNGRLEEYLAGKNLIPPKQKTDYESSLEAQEALRRGKAAVAQNANRVAQRKSEGKRR